MLKIILAGGPHTGKTTLFHALKDMYINRPQIVFLSEPATEVIFAEQQKEKSLTHYKGIFPWDNYHTFAKLVIAKSVALEKSIPASATMAVLDRSLIDTIAYARLNNCNFLLPQLFNLVQHAHYSQVFLCDPVGNYQETTIRSETAQFALKTHDAIYHAYQEQAQLHHYKLTSLHAMPLLERIAITRCAIDSLLC